MTIARVGLLARRADAADRPRGARRRRQRTVRRRSGSSDRADRPRSLADRDHRSPAWSSRSSAEAINGSGERAFNLRFPLPPAMTGSRARQAHRSRRPRRAGRLLDLLRRRAPAASACSMPQRVFLKHRGDTVAAKAGRQAGAGRLGRPVRRRGDAFVGAARGDDAAVAADARRDRRLPRRPDHRDRCDGAIGARCCRRARRRCSSANSASSDRTTRFA